MTVSENAAPTSTTKPIDQTLAVMIWAGVTGITSRCSMVPCSRSRMRAAPVKMSDSMVTMLMISMSEPNHDCWRLGLNCIRRASSTGVRGLADAGDELVHLGLHDLLDIPVAGERLVIRVASTLSWTAGARQHVALEVGRMFSTNVKRPASSPASASSSQTWRWREVRWLERRNDARRQGGPVFIHDGDGRIVHARHRRAGRVDGSGEKRR